MESWSHVAFTIYVRTLPVGHVSYHMRFIFKGRNRYDESNGVEPLKRDFRFHLKLALPIYV